MSEAGWSCGWATSNAIKVAADDLIEKVAHNQHFRERWVATYREHLRWLHPFDNQLPGDTRSFPLYHMWDDEDWAEWLSTPAELVPQLVRSLVDENHARYGLPKLEDAHWEHIKTWVGGDMGSFGLNVAHDIAAMTSRRVSDVLRDAMKNATSKSVAPKTDACGQAVEQAMTQENSQSQATSKRPSYDPDKLWEAIEDICKGGG
jgi:hypothetical protein